MEQNRITGIIIDTSVKIHKEIGPGLLENAYEAMLSMELERRGLLVERQVPIPLLWRDQLIAESFRADLIVEKGIIIELKSIETITQIHKKQLLTYLRVSGLQLGLLLNFGAALMVNGIYRIINGKAQ